MGLYDITVARYMSLLEMLENEGVTQADMERLIDDGNFFNEVVAFMKHKIAEIEQRRIIPLRVALSEPSTVWIDGDAQKTRLINALMNRLRLPRDANLSVLTDYTERDLRDQRGIGDAGMNHILEIMSRYDYIPKSDPTSK